MEVEWDRGNDGVFVATIEVQAFDRSRLLADVSRVVSEHHLNIVSARTATTPDRVSRMSFDVELADPTHLHSLISALKHLDGVFDAYRQLPARKPDPRRVGALRERERRAPGATRPDPDGHARRLVARVRPVGGHRGPLRRAGRGRRLRAAADAGPRARGVFHRGIGEGSEVVGKEMYVFEDRDGQVLALRPEGTAPVARAFVAAPPGAALEGLVRRPIVPPRAAPARALPAALPARRGGARPGRSGSRRRGGRAGPRLLRSVRSARRDAQAALHGRRCLPSRLRGSPRRLPGRTRRPALPGAPRPPPGEPPARAGLQERGVPGGHRGRAPPARPPLRRMPRPLRTGAGRARLARRGLRDRPPSRPGLRLLHPHHVRVRLRRTRRGAERDRGRGALRRARRDAGRPAHARASASGSGSSASCSPATPRASSRRRMRRRRAGCTPT